MIRQAVKEDYTALVSLFREENAHNHNVAPDRVAVTYDVLTLTELEDMINDPAIYLGVFEKCGTLAGVLVGVLTRTVAHRWATERCFAYLEELVVTEERRGQKVAYALVSAFQEWSIDQGASCIDLHVWQENEIATTFYSKLGFEPRQLLMSMTVKK